MHDSGGRQSLRLAVGAAIAGFAWAYLRHRHHPRRTILALTQAAEWFVACGGAATPLRTFDPAAPCTADGQQPGAYPELEALLPSTYEGAAPQSLDSGRTCSEPGLGVLAASGIHEFRFAGATWGLGGTTGLTVAVFEADGLDAGAMIDFYAAGARGNRKVEKAVASDVTAGAQPARRLDVLQSDGAYQTIVAWPGGIAGRVLVLLAADLGDARVAAAVEMFAAP